jgi:hypothetical protein
VPPIWKLRARRLIAIAALAVGLSQHDPYVRWVLGGALALILALDALLENVIGGPGAISLACASVP